MHHGYQVRPGQARASKATGRKLMCPRGNTPFLKTGSAALHSPIPQKCVRGGMGWSVATWGCLPASRGNPLAKIQSSRPPSSSGSRAVPWITAGTHRPVVSASHRGTHLSDGCNSRGPPRDSVVATGATPAAATASTLGAAGTETPATQLDAAAPDPGSQNSPRGCPLASRKRASRQRLAAAQKQAAS